MASGERQRVQLVSRRAWVFDMDGTLTETVHDFDAIRAELGLPPGRPILEALAELPAAVAAAKHAALDELELELARRGRATPGTAMLLSALKGRGCHLGVLTRNSRRNAHVTLEAAGLLELFDHAFVLGRDDAAPKPNPAGILHLLEHWRVPPEEAVMVGDYRFDLEAGRAAGAATVYVDPTGAFEFEALADLSVRRLDELLSGD